MQCPVVLLLFKMMLSSIEWISWDLCQNLTETRRRYFWTVDSILWLVHIVVPHLWLLLPCSKFWIEKSKTKYVLINVLAHLSSGFYANFKICLSISAAKPVETLTGLSVILQIWFGSMSILTILSPIWNALPFIKIFIVQGLLIFVNVFLHTPFS